MLSLRQYRQIRDIVANEAPEQRRNVAPDRSSDQQILTEENEKPSPPQDRSYDALKAHGRIYVEWDGPGDPVNPRNWPMAKRIWIFTIIWINVFAVDWASSADSQANSQISKEFHVSEEAETLSPTLYTFGIALGALFAGPISETVGRNPIYVVSRIFQFVWLLGAALAPNFGAQCAFRFLAGLGASILLAIHAASMADIFSPLQRTVAWPAVALASFFGTAFSPIAGAWIAQTISWRWTEWISFILSGSTLLLTIVALPETFSPVLLKWKAEHLRAITGDHRFVAHMEVQQSIALRLKANFTRAIHMITREPIVVLLGLWLVIIYIVVFGFLQGFSDIFMDTYDIGRGLTGTCFSAIGLGTFIWTCSTPLYYHYYKRRIITRQRAIETDDRDSKEPSDEPKSQSPSNSDGQMPSMAEVPDAFDSEKAETVSTLSSPHYANTPGSDLPQPEYRLWLALLAAPALPISMFWLGWTNFSSISIWSSLGAVTLFGFAWAGIYVTVYQYILDVYGIYAGSALAIITFFRYMASGAVSLFARPMYAGIGVHWTMTWLGCVAVLLTPVPVVLWYVGPHLRAKSHFAGMYTRPLNERTRTGRALAYR